MILSTLKYFNLFDYPLTLIEIKKWLFQDDENNLETIKNKLEENPTIEQSEGFYFLKGREQIVNLRKQKYLYTQKKYKKRFKYIKLISYLPHVSGIFIVNNLAISNVDKQSDIDLLIISKKNKIWTTRFFTTSIIKLLGLRPNPNKSEDKICLSVYLTEDNLNLEKYKIGKNDIHFTYWVNQMIPVYNPGNIYQKFIQTNNWIKKDLPNSFEYSPPKTRQIKNNLLKNISKNILSIFCFEKLFKKIQLSILPNKLKNLMNKDTRVVVSDQILKFHDNDPRVEIQQKYDRTK